MKIGRHGGMADFQTNLVQEDEDAISSYGWLLVGYEEQQQ